MDMHYANSKPILRSKQELCVMFQVQTSLLCNVFQRRMRHSLFGPSCLLLSFTASYLLVVHQGSSEWLGLVIDKPFWRIGLPVGVWSNDGHCCRKLSCYKHHSFPSNYDRAGWDRHASYLRTVALQTWVKIPTILRSFKDQHDTYGRNIQEPHVRGGTKTLRKDKRVHCQ